jgi:GNAT superfamily N-acetyltransferase
MNVVLKCILPEHGPQLRQAAELFAASRQAAMPWLPVLHSAEEDLHFFSTRVAVEATLMGAFEGELLLGLIAYDHEWVRHLYVKPGYWKLGLGSRLLALVFEVPGPKKLYVFQDNEAACRFYEAKGFMAVAFGDGTDNEEKKPDVLYQWGRAEG